MDDNQRIKIRMRFVKTGGLRFVGHLDLMRCFQKAFRRAHIDVAYSKGYSPHQLMSFASPLGVGLTSDGEYLDVELASFDLINNEKDMIQMLNEKLTDELFITEAKIMPDGFKNSMSMLSKADYVVTAINKEGFFDGYKDMWYEFLSKPHIIIKKEKKKKKSRKGKKNIHFDEKEYITIDLRPEIHAWGTSKQEFESMINTSLPTLHNVYAGENIYMRLSAGSERNIKPEQVMDAFFDFSKHTDDGISYHVHRIDMVFTEI